MKIGMLITTGFERPAGVRYGNIARGLVMLGHDVTLLGLHPDFASCELRRIQRDGVEMRYVGQMHARKAGPQHQRFGPLALLRVVIQSAVTMAAVAAQLDVDLYHLGKPQPINGLAGLLASRARRRPLYLDCDDYEAGSNRFSFGWQRRVFAWWEDHLPARALGVTANTRFLARRALEHGAPRTTLVPNGIDRERFVPLPAPQRAALRRSLGCDQGPLIGYIGSLSLNNHPVDLLLRSFALVLASEPQAMLLIVGGGEDALSLQTLAAQLGIARRVRFAGHVPLSAVAGFTSLCDITVDPVHDDDVARARCPLKLIESLALGIPMVTGDVGDRWALLDQGRAGRLVTAGSPTALASGLLELLRDQPLRAALGHVAQTHAARYDWRVLARQWQTIYES